MTVLISNILEEVRAKISSFTGINVTVGPPVDSESGLYIFAYMFSEDSAIRNSPANNIQGIRQQSYIISCLLMSSLPNDYVALDKGLRCLTEHPVLTSDETTTNITIPSPSIEDLTRVFKSSGITLRLAIPFALRCTGK